MDIVGYCESCDRWFACIDDDIDRFVCTWCGRQPIRLKGRLTAEGEQVASMVGATGPTRGR
jgi:hypothetical protein